MKRKFIIIVVSLFLFNVINANSKNLDKKFGIYMEMLGGIEGTENVKALEKYKVTDADTKYSMGAGYGIGGKFEYSLLSWISVDFSAKTKYCYTTLDTKEVTNSALSSLSKQFGSDDPGKTLMFALNVNFNTPYFGTFKYLSSIYCGVGIGYYTLSFDYWSYISSQNISEEYNLDILPQIGWNFKIGYKGVLNEKIVFSLEFLYTMVTYKVDKISYVIYNNGTKETGELTGDKLKTLGVDEIKNNFLAISFGTGIVF